MILTSVLHLNYCLENAISIFHEMKPYIVHLHFKKNHFTRGLSNSSCWSPCRNMHIHYEQRMLILQLCHPFTLWQCLHKMESRQAGECHVLQFGITPTRLSGNFHQEDSFSTLLCRIYTDCCETQINYTQSDRIWIYKMNTEEKHVMSFHLILGPL